MTVLKKWIVVTVSIALLAYFGYESIKRIPIKGIESTEVWLPTDQLDITKIPSLEMTRDDFKILVLSDIQLETSFSKDRETLALIDRLVEKTQPDLILTTGDNAGWSFSNFETKKLIKKFENYGIPWAVTLGNHDAEGMADRNWHGNQYEGAENSLFRMGPSTIHGVGNYAINLKKDDQHIYTFVMMDSNALRKYENGTDYDIIYPDQILWYEWMIQSLDAHYGKQVKSMLFTHIPLPEFKYAVEDLNEGKIEQGLTFGVMNEAVYCPPINSGLFSSIQTLKSTTHVFVGHDHINSLSVPYEGVRLTYGLKTGTTSYSHDELQGGLLITVTNEQVTIDQIFDK